VARIEDGMKPELQYADALQNLMLSLDAQGKVVANFLYGPFGEVVYQDGEATHRRQFNGKENDAISGLRYYGIRYYDPVVLRWNSAGPLYRIAPDFGLRQPQRMNLYSFNLNNPVRYYDPDGRDSEESTRMIEEGSPETVAGCDPTVASCLEAEPTEEEVAEQNKKKAEDKPLVSVKTTEASATLEFFTVSNDGVTVVEIGGTLMQTTVAVGDKDTLQGRVTTTEAKTGVKLNAKNGSLSGAAGFETKTNELCVESCAAVLVCVEVCGSIGPQAKAAASVGKETGAKLGVGLVDASVKVKFNIVKQEPRPDTFPANLPETSYRSSGAYQRSDGAVRHN
jgi:RHS repeat-associated protein